MARDVRTEELRETLHVQVSAAAAVSDGGEAFKKMDAILAGKAGAVPEGVNKTKPGSTPLTPAQAAEIAASLSAAARSKD